MSSADPDEAGADLVLTRISKSYPGVQALSEVSFSVGAGRVHALLGENGAGKSTLIRVLAGVEQADHGSMAFGDQPYLPSTPLAALSERVSTLYQEQNLFLDRTVAQNVLVGSEPHRLGLLDRRAMHRASLSLLERLGADHISPSTVVGRLGVADRQMVDIARALHRNCRLLIMDEPTAALTSREVDALFRVIGELPGLGASVLFVSHRMEEIFRISDDVTILRDGRHVRTSLTGTLQPDDIVRAMIGRDPDSAFPPRAQPTQSRPVLTVEHLSGSTFTDVSFTVHAGQVLALAGVTSSGKEDVGTALFGATPVHAGRILVDGAPKTMTPRRAARLGVVGVPADRKGEGVIGPLPVQRNLSLPALRDVSVAAVMLPGRERALATRQVTSLAIKTARLSTPVEQLSGGNQQKVSLGKWLHHPQRVLVLLEPTQGIDVGIRFEFYRLVRRLTSAGTGVVLVSSDVPEILGLADRIVVLRAGRVVGELDGATATAESLLRLSLGQHTSPQPPTIPHPLHRTHGDSE